jgi:predicted dehydrogenase/threonine dehydrogenase-like Zn-dependent dehydrogenase
MRQLTQKLKEGQPRILDVPTPVLAPGTVLVRNHFSVISAGTESSTVSAARKSYIGKAKERPQQAKQVFDSLRTKGLVQTYRAVMKKLDAHSPLGYSSAGEVVEVAPDVTGFGPGDMVACGGAGYANHAEYVVVPENLCVKLPEGARLDRAAYNTVGAIALQGLRQADLRLGETVVVIGLGLLGQLTCLMARAAGQRVIGIDVREQPVELAKQHCADAAFTTSAPGLAQSVHELTGGVGADAVVITAATSSDQPINMAGELLRKKGVVVIVGNVPTNFERDTYYKKELDLRMSCSYGPGRYDPDYEEGGHDYPPSYVRWTENRNMQAFQDLVHSGRIDLDYVTTHRFPLEDAPKAYDLILEGQEQYLGMLIEYDVSKSEPPRRVDTGVAKTDGDINVAFIGAGSYAMNNLLPNLGEKGVVLKGVMTATGTGARSVADRYGFEFCTSDDADIWQDDSINTVFVATRHDTHAEYVMKALKAGRHVFVEKPLCLTLEELEDISAELASKDVPPILMVGYNRRFSPLSVELKRKLGEGPMSMIYRVNAGAMPADSWMQQKDVGGGRIIGEACHFVDYLTFMNGSLPVEVYATEMEEPEHLGDTMNISLRFENGSIGTVSYFANGARSLPKEYIEVYRAGTTGVLVDFKELRVYGSGKPAVTRLPSQNKGQPQMMKAVLAAIREGGASPIPFDEIYAGTLMTLRAVECATTRQVFRTS